MSPRSITVESAWFGRTGRREVFPLETIERADVRSLLGPIRSRLALVGTDGARSEYLLGTHHDHVAVAEWLNGHLERVEQLESVDEVIPIELKRLSRAAVRESAH